MTTRRIAGAIACQRLAEARIDQRMDAPIHLRYYPNSWSHNRSLSYCCDFGGHEHVCPWLSSKVAHQSQTVGYGESGAIEAGYPN